MYMISLGLVSLMLCIGILLHKKLKILQKTLIPISVISGILGFFIINFLNINKIDISKFHFNDIIDILFTLSFISIGLTQNNNKKENQQNHKKNTKSARQIFGMSLIWCILYAVTPIIGAGIIALMGNVSEINPLYGCLIPFAFCQGPGQATTYGRLFENVYGYENAEMVALTFSVIGFFSAFIIGIPFAKYGVEKGLTMNKDKINIISNKNNIFKEEQNEIIGKVTIHSSCIDTLALHFAFMGVCYLITIFLVKIVSLFPGLGTTFSAMNFFWGLISACLIKKIIKLLKIDYLLDNNLQTNITSCITDFLVVCSFMAVHLQTVGKWLIPILIVSIVCTIITIILCLYFSERLGSDHDFERFLGIYGTCTGTVPCGISLLKLVDPKLKTGVDMELGIMNIGMSLSTPVVILIMAAGLQKLPLLYACFGIIIIMLIYLILMKILHLWEKPTFSLKNKSKNIE